MHWLTYQALASAVLVLLAGIMYVLGGPYEITFWAGFVVFVAGLPFHVLFVTVKLIKYFWHH